MPEVPISQLFDSRGLARHHAVMQSPPRTSWPPVARIWALRHFSGPLFAIIAYSAEGVHSLYPPPVAIAELVRMTLAGANSFAARRARVDVF